MQLIAGRTAQEYNLRKKRKGDYQIKETQLPYCPESENTAMDLIDENTFLWDI